MYIYETTKVHNYMLGLRVSTRQAAKQQHPVLLYGSQTNNDTHKAVHVHSTAQFFSSTY